MKKIFKVGNIVFTVEIKNYHLIQKTTVFITVNSKEIYNPYENKMSQDYFGSTNVIVSGKTEKVRANKLYDFLMNYFSKGWKLMNPSLEKKILKIIEESLEVFVKDYSLKKQNKALKK